jgi:photoactive yellow protein
MTPPLPAPTLDDLYQRVDHLSPRELDALPHGAIQLDREGKVLQFNQYESSLSRLAPANVVGKNFFREVAPCTNVQEFHGRFVKGVAARQLAEKFRYHFAFKQNPRNVVVSLFYSDKTDSVWVFVRPIES